MPNQIRKFDNEKYKWKADIDYRKNPHLYKVGRGEQGVLLVRPYTDDIVKYWRFKTLRDAIKSGRQIYRIFLQYLAKDDFVGADMARKFLQMGYTRARRYANYRSGRKYDADGRQLARGTGDPDKAKSAQIFYEKWREAASNKKYTDLKSRWISRYG